MVPPVQPLSHGAIERSCDFIGSFFWRFLSAATRIKQTYVWWQVCSRKLVDNGQRLHANCWLRLRSCKLDPSRHVFSCTRNKAFQPPTSSPPRLSSASLAAPRGFICWVQRVEIFSLKGSSRVLPWSLGVWNFRRSFLILLLLCRFTFCLWVYSLLFSKFMAWMLLARALTLDSWIQTRGSNLMILWFLYSSTMPMTWNQLFHRPWPWQFNVEFPPCEGYCLVLRWQGEWVVWLDTSNFGREHLFLSR